MLDPLEVHLLDFPNIVIKGSDLQLPFQSSLKIEKFAELILKAQEPQMVLYNLYDEWLKSVSSFTAFSRLMLILRALHVNVDKARSIMRPNKTIVTKPNHIWPTLSDEEWIKVEVELKNLVINDYAKKNNVNPASLTQLEIRDIILGMEMPTPNVQNEQVKGVEAKAKAQDGATVTVQTTNDHNQRITTTATTNYEQAQFKSHTDWRLRALSATNMLMRTNNVWVNSEDIKESGFTYIMPKNLLKKFVCISDLKIQIFGYLYGITIEGSIREIKCIVLVPQVGSRDGITIPHQMPESQFLKGYELLGWIHTSADEKHQLGIPEALMQTRFLNDNPGWSPDKTIILNVAFTPGSLSLTAYKLNLAGYEFLKANPNPNPASFTTVYYEKSQLLLSEKFLGFFMVPDNVIWNYNFIGLGIVSNLKYTLVPSNPKEFYHESHRPAHFLRFIKSDEGEEDEKVDVENLYD
jgi:pre-mRNA-processing factor 8